MRQNTRIPGSGTITCKIPFFFTLRSSANLNAFLTGMISSPADVGMTGGSNLQTLTNSIHCVLRRVSLLLLTRLRHPDSNISHSLLSLSFSIKSTEQFIAYFCILDLHACYIGRFGTGDCEDSSSNNGVPVLMSKDGLELENL